MKSKYRLVASPFVRSEGKGEIEPKRIIFLSVEGENTEYDYFRHLQRELDNNNAPIIHIEILRHKRSDGYSAPQHIVELLNEYIALKNDGVIPPEILKEFLKKYEAENISKLINNPQELDKNLRNKMEYELFQIGIDLEYRRYLDKLGGREGDIFAIVIDRDCKSHSRELMEWCLDICKEKKCQCYFVNPCFEFWLLLHLCNVSKQYDSKLDKFLSNDKISSNHTFTSGEVSRLAHHGKSITYNNFKNNYASNITIAMARANDFAVQLPEIIDRVGTNLPELFLEMGFKEDSERHSQENI